MRTVSALYLDLANYPTYGDLKAAKVSYTALALKTFHDGSASGSSTSGGSATLRAAYRPVADGTAISGGSANPTMIEALWPITASGSSTSGGSATMARRFTVKATAGTPIPRTYGELGAAFGDYAALAAAYDTYLKAASKMAAPQSTGSAAFGIVRRVTGNGTSTSTGQAILGTLYDITATASPRTITYGEIAGQYGSYTELAAAFANYGVLQTVVRGSNGSCQIRTVQRQTGTALSTSAGSAYLLRVKLLTASGTSTSTGTGTQRLIVRTTPNAMSVSTGTITERHLAAANGWGIPI